MTSAKSGIVSLLLFCWVQGFAAHPGILCMWNSHNPVILGVSDVFKNQSCSLLGGDALSCVGVVTTRGPLNPLVAPKAHASAFDPFALVSGPKEVYC